MIQLFVVGYGRPDLLKEQARLFKKYLKDPFELRVMDNTHFPECLEMEETCNSLGIQYTLVESEKHEHNDALNKASLIATNEGYDFWMTLDHDVFPRRKTTLINKIKVAGFYGIGQFHQPTKGWYLWPGFCGFSREWLNGRMPNFNGIRGVDKRDDGDCGSMLASLFLLDDRDKMPRHEHGYKVIRQEDEWGLQSYGIEYFDDMVHLTNASHWMAVPEPDERDAILRDLVEKL